ncbi:MAG TPA: DNA methyltransferase, partial [Granulicella sp.]|nr:DNA methyltransferase [Granulicella sp.]
MSQLETQLRCTGSRELLSGKLAVVDRLIGQLKSDAANPRLHSKKQIRQIANSIEAFGFNVPILIDRDDKLIAGHGRLLAARVLCGNALDPEAFATLMGGERAAVVFTDPPYNVPIEGHASGLGAIHHRPFPMASGEMDKAEFTSFLGRACRNLATCSAGGSLHYVCMDWRHLDELLAAGAEAYGELKNVCVWIKDNPGMGSLYRSQHEFVFVFKQRGGSHRNNVQLGQFGRNRSNVWRYPGINSFARSTGEGNLLALHPTVKPVAMVADAILDCSARSEIVLDAFLGSGTTVIAAERVGRRCCGLELDPGYVGVAIRRWQALTG